MSCSLFARLDFSLLLNEVWFGLVAIDALIHSALILNLVLLFPAPVWNLSSFFLYYGSFPKHKIENNNTGVLFLALLPISVTVASRCSVLWEDICRGLILFPWKSMVMLPVEQKLRVKQWCMRKQPTSARHYTYSVLRPWLGSHYKVEVPCITFTMKLWTWKYGYSNIALLFFFLSLWCRGRRKIFKFLSATQAEWMIIVLCCFKCNCWSLIVVHID